MPKSGLRGLSPRGADPRRVGNSEKERARWADLRLPRSPCPPSLRGNPRSPGQILARHPPGSTPPSPGRAHVPNVAAAAISRRLSCPLRPASCIRISRCPALSGLHQSGLFAAGSLAITPPSRARPEVQHEKGSPPGSACAHVSRAAVEVSARAAGRTRAPEAVAAVAFGGAAECRPGSRRRLA